MSTPSPRPLSFNAAPLSLYRQLLSIIRWLGKMASATLEELLLCSFLSIGCGLERCRNSGERLVIKLKSSLDITRAHAVVWGGFYEEVCLRRHLCVPCHKHVLPVPTLLTAVPSHRWPCQSPLVPVFQWFRSEPVDSAHPPSNLSLSSRARRGLRSPSPSFSPWLYLQPLKVHSLAWRQREENQNCSRRARITGETRRKKKKEGKKWCKFRRRVASRQGTELKESLNARHRLWGSIYLFVMFLSKCIVLFSCWQTKMVGGNY